MATVVVMDWSPPVLSRAGDSGIRKEMDQLEIYHKSVDFYESRNWEGLEVFLMQV